MQKPDVNGFVNITWPSQNISHGGIFHTRLVEPSTEKQQFLKVLLEESKLDIELRRKSAAKKKGVAEENRQPVPEVPTVRPRTSRRRSLSAIRESGVLDVDNYRPLKKGEDREKLKASLARAMEYGDTPESPVVVDKEGNKPVKKKLPSNQEKWNDLLTQIRERAEWLAEMEYLGEGEPHRDIIKEQIAERMRALDALGVDTRCSTATARSSASGFSTTRSKEAALVATQAARKPPSQRSTTSAKSIQRIMKSTRRNVEENVSAYSSAQLSPLQYSPRRRQ